MRRIHRTLLTAVILFGGAGGYGVYVLHHDVKDPNRRRHDEVEKERVFPAEFGLDDVKSGELMTRGATITFTLDEAHLWQISQPVQWRADPSAIEDAINQMVGARLEPESRVENPDAKLLGNWHLDKPRTRLTLDTAKGRFVLLVGPKNPLREMYPITDGDHRAAGLTSLDFYWAFDKPLSDFRERRVFPFATDEVKRVVRTGPDGFQLERGEDAYTLADPDGTGVQPADPERAEIFLVALTQHLKIGRFLTDDYSEKDAPQYGLEHPLRLEVTPKEGPAVTAEIREDVRDRRSEGHRGAPRGGDEDRGGGARVRPGPDGEEQGRAQGLDHRSF